MGNKEINELMGALDLIMYILSAEVGVIIGLLITVSLT